MPDEATVAIGLDLGTSGLKAVAVDADGRVLARATRGYPTRRPEPAAAEQDPADWLSAIDAALADVALEVPPQCWGAIGLSAMLPTLVPADASGDPVHPAITWEDGRAEPEAAALVARAGAERLYRDTGQHVDGRYLVPMLARLQARGVRAAALLGAKDWLVRRLTGRALTDPSTATGSGAWLLEGGAWDTVVLDGLPAAVTTPVVVRSDHTVALLPEVAARWGCAAGTPLVVGAADSVLGAYGMAVRTPGDVACIAGTSTVFLGIVPSPEPDPAGACLITPTADGGWAREADLIATGSAFDWLARLLRIGDASALVALADGAELADAPIVLPYLGPGEQGALWDPTLTGALTGVTLRTGPAELALGLLAGIVLESARCIDAVSPAGGEVVASGSGATTPFLRRLADATGRTVRGFAAERDHSAIGAALLAGRSALGFPDTGGPSPDLALLPDPARRAKWGQRFVTHERARLALLSVHR